MKTRTERFQERQRMQRRIRAAVAERRLARALLADNAVIGEAETVELEPTPPNPQA